MSRWHTGHSLGIGVIGGLLLSRHTVALCGVAFLAGLALGRGWTLIDAGVRRLRRGAA